MKYLIVMVSCLLAACARPDKGGDDGPHSQALPLPRDVCGTILNELKPPAGVFDVEIDIESIPLPNSFTVSYYTACQHGNVLKPPSSSPAGTVEFTTPKGNPTPKIYLRLVTTSLLKWKLDALGQPDPSAISLNDKDLQKPTIGQDLSCRPKKLTPHNFGNDQYVDFDLCDYDGSGKTKTYVYSVTVSVDGRDFPLDPQIIHHPTISAP